MQYAIRNRWSGAVQFTAEIDCAEDAPTYVKIGIAVRWAYRSDADLRDADLRGADLSDAFLRGAVLRGAKVDGQIGIITAGEPNHWSAFGFVDHDTKALIVCVGCRTKEIGEGRAYWSSEAHPEPENRREVLAALDYIEAVARLRGWEG